MSERTFGQGFLADRLYNLEDPIPSGTFDAIRRKRRKRPVFWLWLLPLALSLGGLSLYLSRQSEGSASQGTTTLASAAHSGSQGHAQPEAPAPSSDHGHATGQTSRERLTLSGNEPSSAPAGPDLTQAIAADGESGALSSEKNGGKSARVRKQNRTSYLKGRFAGARTLNRRIGPTGSIEGAERQEMHDAVGSAYPDDLVASEKETAADASASAQAPELAFFAAEGSSLAPDMMQTRLPSLAFSAHRLDLGEVWPVAVGKPRPFSLGRSEVLVSLGPMALLQQTSLTASNAPGAEPGMQYQADYLQPGIGLEASVSVRTALSPSLALLAGASSLALWQAATGTAIPTQRPQHSYQASGIDNLLYGTPVSGRPFTAKSLVWMPVAPQCLLEARLPRASWGIAAGAYLVAATQTFTSTTGASLAAEAFATSQPLQPMAQFWAEATRTRIAVTARRIQGQNLLPYPAPTQSTGWAISASMSYRLGW